MEEKIKEDLKQAQLARDEVKVSTLRLLLSEMNNVKIAKSADLTDEDIISIAQREIKKRREAATGFRDGDREESALKEEAELKILEVYLPAQMPDEELTKIVTDAINEVGANSLADMGKVMSLVMSKVGSGAEGSRVSSLVKEKLSN